MAFIVAIDGPAGTGKSSVAREVSRQLGFIYVDTGALYRALAYLCERKAIDPENEGELLKAVDDFSVFIDQDLGATCIKVNGHILDSELRSENISRLSSIVSKHKLVREKLLAVQRALVKDLSQGAVFEGRDIGTVVFPRAPLKIFVTASSATRAKRRFDEIKARGQSANYQEILEAIEKRDDRDQSRANAPMQKADDAVLIDSSHMKLSDVIAKTIELIEKATVNFKERKPW
jgi:cytidylate kinase